ncbi:hypothetical protein POM88_047426 [Heracleum sosnowskyi]|uniref:Serine-threonine/tyrosine-protein kinase catalytic domain-containing protein n=1 Tax=Heracleum sosnowskyi TaxID=360622 RepID=A0AAD8GS11_9APIA|nr:hypothetical protein POM88_047426 [Heracleum sosnowskyi]
MAFRNTVSHAEVLHRGKRSHKELMQNLQQQMMLYKENTDRKLRKIEEKIEQATQKMKLIQGIKKQNKLTNPFEWEVEKKQNRERMCLAPEYAMRGHVTEKADVFGFGVVALEVVSGSSNSDFKTIYLMEFCDIRTCGEGTIIISGEFDAAQVLDLLGPVCHVAAIKAARSNMTCWPQQIKHLGGIELSGYDNRALTTRPYITIL